MTATIAFRELTGGAGRTSVMSATAGPDLDQYGYSEREYAASGIAHRFVETPDGGLDGVDAAQFATRILVRRPADTRFNGHVVVEWFNVSSGADSAPEYTYLAQELVRSGTAYVGISAQYTGIAGGRDSVDLETTGAGTAGVQGDSLAAKDPQRYQGLHHPGDGYSYDIFGSIAKALRDSDSEAHPLAGLDVRRTIAAGESQSAMALTTYVNRIAPMHDAIDGALIHSRPLGQLPLGEPGAPIDISPAYLPPARTIHPGTRIPVFVVQTETDVLTDFRYAEARQPDSDTFRSWEVAGTSHADLVQIGEFEELLGCPQPVNRGQQVFVLRSALAHLRAWVGDGTPPPANEPLAVDFSCTPPRYVLDDDGNVVGGVRTPCVDAPTEVLSGVVTGDVPRICVLFGSTTPLPADVLTTRYPTPAEYLRAYEEATDDAIARGVISPADRDEVLADARPGPLSS
ncbi:alpha/beta hydrolase domain-containing protein [Gordonia aichiensis]|uniref:Alpha/beta hydrolase domain-containing protein n=1 Tax=Gordonia aichiensis NBRC 108223 TaxID=1220583 RepID=L7KE63_9ACTN|nr:alpha/beta hydrolase domain-containing protein [Gordonia aichiensis]GAC47170.1 hypothetical protein GOACH_03_01880 [Gordonia aichiensis NBRC 108223]